MSKTVLFSRWIRLEWLDKTVDIYCQSKDHTIASQMLDEYLSGFIVSPNTLRKTRYILMRTWIEVDGEFVAIRNKAIDVYYSCPENERAAIHWAMMLLAFPIFRDLCQVIGKLNDLQGDVTQAQITRRIFDLWGERSTLMNSIPKNIKTLREIGVLEQVKPGSYKVIEQTLKSKEVINLLILAAMMAGDKLYYNLSEIEKFKELFPFVYEAKLEEFIESGVFKLDRIGGEPVVSV